MWRADLTAVDGLLDPRVVGVKASVEADHQADTRLFHHIQGLIDNLQIRGDGLLTENVLARLCRLADEGRVCIRTGANHNGVNRLIRQNFH